MRGKALVVLDIKKKETRLVGVSGINRLDHPVAVAVADDGTIYVADNSRGSVFVFDAEERYSHAIGFPKFKPVGVAVRGDRLYAADMAGQNVVIYERKSGKKLGVIGTVGDEDGQFRVPLGVSTDRDGNVYVMDMMACRLQKFSRDGVFISKMGSLGDYQGTFTRPKHIAVDNDGLIYIVDAAFENVQLFESEYHLLMHFGALGDFPGAMNLPAGISVTDDGLDLVRDRLHPGFAARRLVVVSNQFGPTKVVVYAVGQRRPDYPIADLAKAAAKLPTGTGIPSEEQLKLQNPGGEDPPSDPAKAGAAPGDKPDQPKPAKPEPPAAPEPR
jgi:DNA-binding beta-propeller fold protein YncE